MSYCDHFSSVVRPYVHPSVNIFKRLLLWNRWANFAQISYGASLGWGNEKLLKWSISIVCINLIYLLFYVPISEVYSSTAYVNMKAGSVCRIREYCRIQSGNIVECIGVWIFRLILHFSFALWHSSWFQPIFLAHLSSAQDELLWSLFVRRPSVRPLTFSNDFSSETAEPILLKFHMEPP